MIKNYALAIALVVGACQGDDPARGAYQGVVEHDDRVLGFEVAGRVRRMAVDRGAAVRAGDLLATVDDTLERIAREARVREVEAVQAELDLARAGSRREEVRGAAAEVRSARANEARARNDLERQRRLFDERAVPFATVQDLETQLAAATAQREALEQRLAALSQGTRPEQIASAEARLHAAEQAVALADERLKRYELRAPAPGAVIDVHVKEGEVVAAGTPVVTVADLEHPFADVFVPQRAMDGVRVGVAASLRVDAAAEPFAGRVEHVWSKTEFTPRFLFSDKERANLVVRVRVRIDDPGHRLAAGVPAFVAIERGAQAAK